MNYIERNIYVTENRIKRKIDYTRGTNALPIYFHFMDFEIPEGAEAKAFVLKPSKRQHIMYAQLLIIQCGLSLRIRHLQK